MQGISRWTADSLKDNGVKFDILDPVLVGGCITPAMESAHWVPTLPATAPAFGLALLQAILRDNAYNEEFLSFPTYQVAFDKGFGSYTNATWLVIIDENHPNKGKFLRPEDLGMEVPPVPEGKKAPELYIVLDKATNEPVLHTDAEQGVLFYEGDVQGIKVKTPMLMLKESAFANTMEEYAETCGIPVEEIERMAKEFTSHGTKASLSVGPGGTAQANGTDQSLLNGILNSMIGSNNMRGGAVPRRNAAASHGNAPRYKLGEIPNKPERAKAQISRTGMNWKDTSEYKKRSQTEDKPLPKLPWYKLPGGADNQALMSVVNQYPYQTKILMTWMGNTLQVTPGAMRDSIIDLLKDTDVVPLHVACDVVIGEHAQYADYIIPDTIPYESFGVRTQEGFWNGKGMTVRWQVVEPETVKIDDKRHASYEAFTCDMGKKLGLPGFGEDAIESVDGKKYPYNDACDYFLKAIANLAYDEKPVPDISEEEIKIQGLDQLPAQWKDAVSEEEWPKVLHVLSRGGRFWPIEEAYDDKDRSAYAVEHLVLIYNEKRATSINSYTGKAHAGVFTNTPEIFSNMVPLREKYPKSEWPLSSVNYKARFRSVTMLANSPIMQQICHENYLEINSEDAKEYGVTDGEIIEVVNPSGDVMRGPAMVRDGVTKGTVAVAFGYGHRAYGAQDIEIDGDLKKGSEKVGAGIHLETMLDPEVEAIFPYADPEAAAPGRSGGAYKIQKA